MKVVFAGTPDFAAGHLDALISSHHEVVGVITQPDKPGKRGKKLVASPVKQKAMAAGIKCLQPLKLTTDELAAFDFDVMIVVAYGQILRPPVLALPRYGCINVHASMLPRWRGAAPVQRAILAGDRETGVTIIQMDKGLDTGDMLASTAIEISPTDTAGSLLSKMLEIGRRQLVETLDVIESGTCQVSPQDDELACYASKIEKGEALIKWGVEATSVDQQVRGFHPDPVAFTHLGDKRIKIHEGYPVHDRTGEPGHILSVDRHGILIGCGTGSYCVTAIQLPVGKGAVLRPADVLNGWTDLLHTDAFFSDKAP